MTDLLTILTIILIPLFCFAAFCTWLYIQSGTGANTDELDD